MISLNHAQKYRSPIINLHRGTLFDLVADTTTLQHYLPQVPENNSIPKNQESLFTFTLLKRLAYNPSSSSKGHLYALCS